MIQPFTVRYIPKGQAHVLTSTMQAESMDAARLQATAQGWQVLTIKPQIRTQWSLSSRQGGVLQARDYAVFAQELSTLLKAGMSVVEAIDTLAAGHAQSGAFKSQALGIAQTLKQQLEQGKALSTAMAALPEIPVVLLACVKSTERTSNLREAIDNYLRYHRMMQQLRSKIISAAIYPSIVTVLGLSIVIFLMMVVMPSFATMYQNLRGQAGGATHRIVILSQYLQEHSTLTWIALVSVIALLALWIFSGRAKKTLLSVAMRAGPLHNAFVHYQLALLYQTLHLLTQGGYAVTEALQTAAQASLHPLMRQRVLQVLTRIEQGKPVAQSLFDAQLAQEVDRRLLSASERNGELPRVALTVSDLHREQFELFVERLTRIAEPLMLLVVALLVGSVVIMMYLPVFEMGSLSGKF